MILSANWFYFTRTLDMFTDAVCFADCLCYVVDLAAEVSITLSVVRPVERRFFIACGGTSVSFLEERCGLKC